MRGAVAIWVVQAQRCQLLLQRAVVGGNGFSVHGLAPVGIKLAQRQVIQLGFQAGQGIEGLGLGDAPLGQGKLFLLDVARIGGWGG